jgi:large subunit ribosomal protein L15
MHVHDLRPAPGATRNRKRVARGIGGHGGKTAGRGTKGQRARNTVPRGFEGGQMPMKQRVPKLKGFNNPFRVEYHGINLDTLEALAGELDDNVINPEVLIQHGLLRKGAFVKVLARGELSAKLEVHTHGVSKAAEAAITAAGGTVTLVPLPFKGENKAGRPPAKGNQFANR